MNLRHLILYFSICILIILSGCRSQKATTSQPDYQPTQVVEEWQDLYIPVTFDLLNPKNLSISGRATMIRDQRILISLRFLGMEVAILDITPQTITLVDKYHKMIVTEPIADILADHDVTITNLQDAILGTAPEEIMKKLDTIPVAVSYGPFLTTDNGSLPRFVNIAATISGKPLALSIRYKPEQAQWNTGRTVGYRLPSEYKTTSARALLENLNNGL